MANKDDDLEPLVTYVNDILIELDAVFPHSEREQMPEDTFYGLPEPEDKPVRGS